MLARLILIKLFSLSCCFIAAQDGYNILYINQYRDKEGIYLPKQFMYTRVVFNDRYVYSYSFYEGTKDPLETNEYPSPKINNGLLTDRSSSNNYFQSHSAKKKYWYYDSSIKKFPKWIFSEEEKNILGYTCKKAYWLNEYFLPTKDSVKTWVQDSTIVWYTGQLLPATNVFYAYSGIRGTVLEIHDQNKHGWYCRAIAINKQPVNIKFPGAEHLKPFRRDKHLKW